MLNWASIALAAPGFLLAAASAIALVLASGNRHPMWSHEPVNIAEAAGTRDEAEVVRLIERGEDFSARYPVRPGLVFDAPAQLTPLEAAIAADDPMIVQQLLRHGAPLSVERWTYLRCIAEGNQAPSVLDQHRPSNSALNCGGVRSPWPQDD